MNPISVRVSGKNQSFLEKMVVAGKSKTDVVNEALDFLRKSNLQSELADMASGGSKEDSSLAEEGMEDYLTLVDDAA